MVQSALKKKREIKAKLVVARVALVPKFQIHFVLPCSKCTDTEKARRAWHGWHLCLMLPLPAGRSRRALVHCLEMLSYSALPSAQYNLVLTYNALPITKYCTAAGACLRRCPGTLATCPGRGTTLGRKT